MCGSFLAPKPPTVAPPPSAVAPTAALSATEATAASEIENPEPIFNPGSELDDMSMTADNISKTGKDKLKTHDTGLAIPV
jgi:hypothetical protein